MAGARRRYLPARAAALLLPLTWGFLSACVVDGGDRAAGSPVTDAERALLPRCSADVEGREAFVSDRDTCSAGDDITGVCLAFSESEFKNQYQQQATVAGDSLLTMGECVRRGNEVNAYAVRLVSKTCQCNRVYTRITCAGNELQAAKQPSAPEPQAPTPEQQPPAPDPYAGLPAGFWPENYGASNPDLLAALGPSTDAMKRHYLDHGQREGRCWNCFDALRYIASHGDLISAFAADGAAGVQHYFHHGHFEGRTLRFDCAAYGARYPDLVAALGWDCRALTLHYITSGHREGRTY